MRESLFGILLSLSAVNTVQPPQRIPILTTPHFAIYNDFDTNLNDALIASGLARDDKKPELFHSGAEATCFDKLPTSARAGWDGAVDYFARIISPAGWDAREQLLLRWQLVGFDAEWQADPEATKFVEIARSFRTGATPAYKTCRWTAQQENNRRWIEDLKPRLAADEQRVAARIEQLYQKKWKSLPILVDVVETVNWSGANTGWSDSGQGDILISNSPQGAAGFETLFHESSHILMDRGDPVRLALENAAKAADFRLPNDLWHVVLFYTTGEAVRPILDERGPSGYTPMLYEIFGRGSWIEYRQALESSWRPYVDGKQSLAEAAANLISALRGNAARPRHLIYLHGRIVQEQQSKRPRHPQFGFYELEKIIEAFRSRGFVVSGEIRPKSASVSVSADRVVEQVRKLIASGVPASDVTVVGASMGAEIALLASARLQNPELRFSVLGACLSESASSLVADEGKGPSGHLLAIREASDESTGTCPTWKDDPKFGSSLVGREIVLHTGLSHGFLYRPLPEWVTPVAAWADQASKRQAAEQPGERDAHH